MLRDNVERACDELMDTLGNSRSLASRMVGEVRRYHSWHLSTEQSVADHTWHVMRLYVQIFGLPTELTMHDILFHDVELLSSDVQFPFKAMVPEQKEISDAGERALAARLRMQPSQIHTTVSRFRIKACDLLEMYEKGTREVMSGNVGTGEPVRRRIHAALARLCDEADQDDTDAVWAHVKKVDGWFIVPFGNRVEEQT